MVDEVGIGFASMRSKFNKPIQRLFLFVEKPKTCYISCIELKISLNTLVYRRVTIGLVSQRGRIKLYL